MFVVYALLAYGLLAVLIAAVVLARLRRRQRADGASALHAPPGSPARDAHLLHRVTLRGRPLRFYRSPLIGPDFPWAVLRDLFEIATGGADYSIASEWVYANNPGLAQVIVVEGGMEMTLSHWAGTEVLRALVADPDECEALIRDYRESMAEAYVLQWAGLTREEFLAVCSAAEQRLHAHAA